ncbi:glycosyltransferase [Luteimonas sp. MC1572]|uniref:glycosyltransferase n=1 Tax=Luteimonas sp. MC1572 TaxID=2799325 RepID=UPI0018F0A01B|nr:glycosyltransferase [Luteimonas sp. MC1572]MBJ6983004.1 glycosyltransferase [Luteimonas sp. MC1572]QQO04219.1 glycosyltransferase [Luteimonas sp. MC1572]
MANGVLYIAYDGMLEPLGQSQVLAYLERLASGRPIHLLSFEKPEDWADADARGRVQARMDVAGIHWHPRRYHKRPSAVATSWDIGIGILSGLWLLLRHRLRIVHARSYVAAVMALALKRLTGARFVFDMRGFWADERVDGGLWLREGRMYRVAKWFERRFLQRADHVVSLTYAGVREMEGFDYLHGRLPPFSVIPTCADLSRFVPAATPREGFVLGYVGSAGTWYLFDAAVACFAKLLELRPDARWLIVNRNEHDYIRERLVAGGVSMHAIELRTADHSEVPAQMARMHAGVFFIKPVFSKQASAPTKLAEFLGCGIPCLGNAGVGDMAGILESERVGVALDTFDSASLHQGLESLMALTAEPDIQARCVAAAHRNFSLDEGVAQYRAVYSSLDRA